MSKLDMQSPNLTDLNIQKMGELFPNCITETRDDNGEIRYAIDFDLLRQELSHSMIEGPVERYQLDWPGKRESLLASNAPIAKTLRPARDESVNFDETENLFIEGDNLEALKLLQESYLGKVKMIYIDPPYNTGNDFVYNDDFAEDTDEYLVQSLQKDEEGNRLVANPESRGRYHSDWLSMMHSRLRLARNLLKEDGLIMLSIDGNEVANLKKLCDEIFGEQNFFSDLVVIRSEGGGLAKTVIKGHDSLLIYAKNLNKSTGIFRPKDIRGKVITVKGREYWIEEDWLRREFGKYGTCLYEEIEEVKGIDKKIEIDQGLESGIYRLIKKEKGHIVGRLRALDEDGSKFYSIIKHLNKFGVQDLTELSLNQYFSYPKPKSLIEELVLGATFFSRKNTDIILDFFAGSSTTAHAVMQLNAEDGGNRKFIMVQLPEETDEKSEAYKAGYKNIAEISKERIRRAGKQILESDDIHEDWNRDIGFRVLKIDSSNMKETFYKPEELTQGDLLAQIENVKEDRTAEDLLFQIMLDWGLPLDLPIEVETIQNKTVYIVAEDALIACFDEGIDEAIVKTLADRKPLRLLFRDNYYASNAVKINAEQLIKQLSPNTELKSI